VAYINHGAPIDDPTVIENVVANIRHYTERIIPDMNELYTLLGGKRRLPNGSFMPTMFNAFVRLTPAGDAVCRLCRETVDRLIHYVFGTDSKKIDVFSLENFIRSSLMLIEDIEVGNTTKYINRNNNRANNTLVVISTKMPEEESDSRDYRIRSVESLRKLIKLSQRS
jgi:hypothetical protein